MALADVCVHEKWRSNVQNESEHRFTSYFILLNSQEQKFDDRFLLQIESLTTQGQYRRQKYFELGGKIIQLPILFFEKSDGKGVVGCNMTDFTKIS